MKTIAIKLRQALPPDVLREADKEAVVLTVKGKPRYVIRSLREQRERGPAPDTSEDKDWVNFASARLLAAYADEDAIYDEL